MSLNSDFRNVCIEAGFNKSCFTGEMHNWSDLQVCHILSKSKTTLNAIKKAYNCSNQTAELIMNMPLLNTLIGNRQDNAEYKKTDDITYIDYKLLNLVHNYFYDNKIYDYFLDSCQGTIIPIFFNTIRRLLAIYLNDKNLCNFYTEIKDIQLQFHREINLHT